MSDKTDFKEGLGRDKGSHFMLMKGMIHQEDITVPNRGTKHRGTLFHKTNTTR